MRLPALPYNVRRSKTEVVSLRGINYSDRFQDGDIADCQNISTHRYPYISTRRARKKLDGYEGVTALTAWGKLVAVQGTNLLYDGEVVGQVTAGEKQFAVVNTKMVIWPDKVYLDMDGKSVKPLGASAAGVGASFTSNTMTVSGWPSLTSLFKVGDCVTISGCTVQAGNNKDIVIKALSDTILTVSDNGFTEAEESAEVKIERRIPDMDYICESENRLWGCSNKARTIYASSLGDPTNFFTYEGLSTDSYALAVGSEGDFTGCCKLSGSVLFWKESCLHKMMGSYPAEYSLYTYNIEGIRSGCHKSMQIINEVLFYMGEHGVYAYSGGTPALISESFGGRDFTDAVAGNDGERYYLTAKEGESTHFFVYDVNLGIWVREDDTMCVDFARIGKELYFLTGGEVWKTEHTDEANVEWFVTFKPFFETVEGRKCYSKILLRLELPTGSWMRAEVRCDGKLWMEAGKVLGRELGSIPFPISINRCDRFEVRLSGRGSCTIKTMLREFSVGSDV